MFVGLPIAGVTPSAGLASTVTSGAVAIASAYVNGGYVVNPLNAAAQGIATAEDLYLDMCSPPGNSDATANGTTVILTPGQSFTIPTIKHGGTIWANAATTGHKFTVVIW